MNKYPKISVITPSYNQALFIESTIKSVISQNYPNLEYILIDGGSTDGTTEIIQKYVDDLAYYISETDTGQANAINKGFKKATGDVICWLNSDDLLEKNALWVVAKHFKAQKSHFIYGDGWVFFEDKYRPRKYINCKVTKADVLTYHDSIQQPSTFWSRKVLDEVGLLNESLNYTLDWEFFIRISKKFDLTYVPMPFSSYRIHKFHKTGTGRVERVKEIIAVVEKYATSEWIDIYSKLYPYYNEISNMKIPRRFQPLLFSITHPHILLNYGYRKVNLTMSMF